VIKRASITSPSTAVADTHPATPRLDAPCEPKNARGRRRALSSTRNRKTNPLTFQSSIG
jgi:hypothetical protein